MQDYDTLYCSGLRKETERNALCRLTIAVYTCSASCVPEAGTCEEDQSPAYAEEYVFVQPPIQN